MSTEPAVRPKGCSCQRFDNRMIRARSGLGTGSIERSIRQTCGRDREYRAMKIFITLWMSVSFLGGFGAGIFAVRRGTRWGVGALLVAMAVGIGIVLVILGPSAFGI